VATRERAYDEVVDALVEIQDVSRAPAGGEPRIEGGIDAPRAGDAFRAYRLDVRGWAIAHEGRVTAVELSHDGSVLRTAPVDVARPKLAAAHGASDDVVGFRTSVGALRLTTAFELEVHGVCEAAARVPLATVRGHRAALRTGFDARYAPLVVTTLGRTGSMALMRMLEPHPQLLVYRPFRFEQRVATYWLDVLSTLAEPASYMRQLAPAGDLDDPLWWTGAEGPQPPLLRDSAIEGWMGASPIEAMARGCQQRIDDLYARVADELEKPGAAMFAEKYPLRTAALARELYPSARELFLVRDPRDMVVSILAFNAKRGVQGFGRAAARSDRDYVLRLGDWARGLVRSWQRRAVDAHLVRYEDLVLRPRETAAAIVSYLGVDSSHEVVDRMTSALSAEVPELAEHGTAPSTSASVARWRDELAPELADACERAFAGMVETFGYEPAR
jgi:hypothetical protein